MNFYENELKALKKSGRYRTRQVYDNDSKDFASNDYLGLSHNKELHQQTLQHLDKLPIHSSKASLLVNGYHQIHKDFEDALCEANGFESAVVVGSGFNANIALVESLVRKGDILFMDELYHASGVLATNLESVNVVFFKHNDMTHLKELLEEYKPTKRIIIAVEGIYSMDGDLCDKEVFEIADNHNAILIVDEAHSSGVVGRNLMGVFDHYNIEIQPNHIKMGTLGKAYGSFGAFILASHHIVEYLINRAKPLIYATSLSLYDTLLAHKALEYILEHKEFLKHQIKIRQDVIYDELEIKVDGLIVPIVVNNNQKVLNIKEMLKNQGYSVGAIRQPTVPKAIIRLIARLDEDEHQLRIVCKKIKSFLLAYKYKKISC
jgi:8-amino-7-oxononanoate synthase